MRMKICIVFDIMKFLKLSVSHVILSYKPPIKTILCLFISVVLEKRQFNSRREREKKKKNILYYKQRFSSEFLMAGRT